MAKTWRFLVVAGCFLLASAPFCNAATSLFSSYKNWHRCPTSLPPSIVSQNGINYINDFPFREAGLTIYLDFRIPCDGWLIQWSMKTDVPTIWGLHLAIFRPSAHRDAYDLIGETYLNGIPVGRNSRNASQENWFAYRANPPLEVKRNDVVGVFYDLENFQNGQASICTSASVPVVPGYKRRPKGKGPRATLKGNALVALLSADDLLKKNCL